MPYLSYREYEHQGLVTRMPDVTVIDSTDLFSKKGMYSALALNNCCISCLPQQHEMSVLTLATIQTSLESNVSCSTGKPDLQLWCQKLMAL